LSRQASRPLCVRFKYFFIFPDLPLTILDKP
jgi:hypothetical protein